jgi:hypothetical protein
MGIDWVSRERQLRVLVQALLRDPDQSSDCRRKRPRRLLVIPARAEAVCYRYFPLTSVILVNKVQVLQFHEEFIEYNAALACAR